MRLHALVEAGDPEAIDVYLCEEDAKRALDDCLRDEPQWRATARRGGRAVSRDVAELGLWDHWFASANHASTVAMKSWWGPASL